MNDAAGHGVPCVLWPHFEYSKRIAFYAKRLTLFSHELDCYLQVASGTEYVDRLMILEMLDKIYEILMSTRPIQLCERCFHSGQGFQTACECRGLGWIPVFGSELPRAKEQMRAIRQVRVAREKHHQRNVDKLKEAIAGGNITKGTLKGLGSMSWLVKIIGARDLALESSRYDLRGRKKPSPRRREPPPLKPRRTSPENSPDE